MKERSKTSAAASQRWLWAIIVAAPAISVIGIVLVGLLTKSDFWYVAVPTYLTGLGTLAAACAAVGVAIYAARSDQRRRDADEHRAAMAEARKILTLCALDARPSEGVTIRNYSSEPITQVKIECVRQARGEGAPEPRWYWEFGNGAGASFVAVLVPGDHFDSGGRWREEGDSGEFATDRRGNPLFKRPPNYAVAWLEATVTWRDCRGQWWRRRGAADPEPLQPASRNAVAYAAETTTMLDGAT